MNIDKMRRGSKYHLMLFPYPMENTHSDQGNEVRGEGGKEEIAIPSHVVPMFFHHHTLLWGTVVIV